MWGGSEMTSGQAVQLQELNKCFMPSLNDKVFVDMWNTYQEWQEWGYWGHSDAKMSKHAKAFLRRLTHLYRHQIKAMKRNRK